MNWSVVFLELINIAVAFITSFVLARLFFPGKHQRKQVMIYGTLAGYLGKYLMDYYGLFNLPYNRWSFAINCLKIIFITGLFVFIYFEITRTLVKD